MPMGIKKKLKELGQFLRRESAERANNHTETIKTIANLQDQVLNVQTEIDRLSDPAKADNTPQDEATAALNKSLRDLSTSVRRHDMSLEDHIEGLQKKDAATLALEQAKDAADAKNESLLQLAIASQDTLFDLRKLLTSDDETWEYQFSLIDETQLPAKLRSSFEVISQKGVHVNYDLHEVTSVNPTPDSDKDSTICEVLKQGYVWQGNVVRKAEVVAWKYSPDAVLATDEGNAATASSFPPEVPAAEDTAEEPTEITEDDLSFETEGQETEDWRSRYPMPVPDQVMSFKRRPGYAERKP